MCDNKHEKSHKCFFAPFSANSRKKASNQIKPETAAPKNKTKNPDIAPQQVDRDIHF